MTKQRPKQHQQKQPGKSYKMEPRPEYDRDYYQGTGKLKGKIAIVTGGDSGIGRSVSLLFAREGADVAVVYLEEDQDAAQTEALIKDEGQRALLLKGGVADKEFCETVVEETVEKFGGINIVVNNAAEQHVTTDFAEISKEQLQNTFETNFFGYF